VQRGDGVQSRANADANILAPLSSRYPYSDAIAYGLRWKPTVATTLMIRAIAIVWMSVRFLILYATGGRNRLSLANCR